MLKDQTNWTPKSIDELIHDINVIVDRHHHDLKAAIHGRGNYILHSTYRRYAVNEAKWNVMGDQWRDNTFKNFIKDSLKIGASEKAISSKRPGLAKKPKQSKRARSERF